MRLKRKNTKKYKPGKRSVGYIIKHNQLLPAFKNAFACTDFIVTGMTRKKQVFPDSLSSCFSPGPSSGDCLDLERRLLQASMVITKVRVSSSGEPWPKIDYSEELASLKH